ncbi:MAG: hypothetical protein M1823_004243 [Watsoniomyces obsoletus]|nr:MAG: hypothetical protein M1823_004243 [Watsoniomyces obsoletus]
MAKTSNTLWLDFRAGLGETILQEYHRSYTTSLDALPRPREQKPSLITMIGSTVKTYAMEKMCPELLPSRVNPGEIHLRPVAQTMDQESPIIIADCELHSLHIWKKVLAGPCAGNIIRRPVAWTKTVGQKFEARDLASVTYARLLSPFTTLLCLFPDDLGGFTGLARMLVTWLKSTAASDLDLATRPRLVIFSRRTLHLSNEKKSTQEFLRVLGQEAQKSFGKLNKIGLQALLSQHFSLVRLVLLPSQHGSTRWPSLYLRLCEDSNDTVQRRLQARSHLSATHFKAFFNLACNHFSQSCVVPFSFIKSSRQSRPVSSELNHHLLSFLHMLDLEKDLHRFAVPVIASSLAFNSGPPGTHVFNPASVFHEHYLDQCETAVHQIQIQKPNVERIERTSCLPALIEESFCLRLAAINPEEKDAASMHLRLLSTFKGRWGRLQSNRTCLTCLAKTPENSLPCGHSLCDLCVRVFAVEKLEEPWTFIFNQCPLCRRAVRATFKLKPPTAGVRILTVDGGGIRGVVALQWLLELENKLDLSRSPSDYFDLALGTSSGALIVLALFMNRWPSSTSLKKFKEFTKLAFRPRMACSFPFFTRFLNMVVALVTDSRYSTSNFESTLIQAFSLPRTMFWNSEGNIKVGVTATTTNDSDTCIFTNYNGIVTRPTDCGYRVVRAVKAIDELQVWEAARMSSAAPPYFKAFMNYHDGGLGGHNNPVRLALWEYRQIWPTQDKEPDILVSLGTGVSRRYEKTVEQTQEEAVLHSRFLPRLFRSFMVLLDGQRTWNDLWNSLPMDTKDRYHRLNTVFDGPEPQLDDIEAMTELEQQTKTSALNNSILASCADNSIASLFYLELDTLPVFEKTHFRCQAYICCRWSPNNLALLRLLTRMARTETKFYVNGRAYSGADQDIMNFVHTSHPYRRPVQFELLHLKEEINVSITGITAAPRNISNCPYVMERLIQDQGLDHHFGREDHQKRKHPVSAEKEIDQHQRKRRQLRSGRIC